MFMSSVNLSRKFLSNQIVIKIKRNYKMVFSIYRALMMLGRKLITWKKLKLNSSKLVT